MRPSYPRSPLITRINRGLFPIDVVTFTARSGVSLGDLSISFEWMGDSLKSMGGGGDGLKLLLPGQAIDVVVTENQQQFDLRSGPDARSQQVTLAQGQTLAMMVGWLVVNGEPNEGKAVVLWSHADRAGGRAPLRLSSRQVRDFMDYLREPTAVATAALFTRAPRVQRATRWDAVQRRRAETRAMGTSMSEAMPQPIQSISVAGFRGFQDPQTLELAVPNGTLGSGLTIVVGANNAGKSTIWESFDAIARKQKGQLSFSEGRRNRMSRAGIEIEATWRGGQRYKLQSLDRDTSETQDVWDPAPRIITEPEILTVPSRRQFQASFGRGGHERRDWMTSGSEFTRSRVIEYANNFTGRLFDLHSNPGKKADFDALMQEVLGERLDWKIELADGQHGQSYYLKVAIGQEHTHTSEGLGDGIISLLYIVNVLFDSEPTSLIVIDEPELSLHPQYTRRLGQVLARFAETRQVVIFTHSPTLVSWDYVANGAEIARVYRAGGVSNISRLERSTVEEVNKARGSWHNPHALGHDAKEALFLEDGLVIVEGQEDAALLPTVYEKCGLEMSGTLFGWGSGGADNIPKILAMLHDLRFRRVAAVVDANRQDVVSKIGTDFPGYFAVTIPADDIRDKKPRSDARVEGLLDERGKHLKPQYQAAITEVLRSVNEFIAPVGPDAI